MSIIVVEMTSVVVTVVSTILLVGSTEITSEGSVKVMVVEVSGVTNIVVGMVTLKVKQIE